MKFEYLSKKELKTELIEYPLIGGSYATILIPANIPPD